MLTTNNNLGFRGAEVCGGPATGGAEVCYRPFNATRSAGGHAVNPGHAARGAVYTILRKPLRVVAGGDPYQYSVGGWHTPTDEEVAAAVRYLRGVREDPVAEVLRYYAARGREDYVRRLFA